MHNSRKLLTTSLMLSSLMLVFAMVLPLITKSSVVGVVYGEGNVPIKGASVTASGLNASGVATTDSTGKYTIAAGLGTGTCSITVTAPGYVDAKVSNVQVTAGSTTSAPSVLLKRSGVISGVVVSMSLEPPVEPPG